MTIVEIEELLEDTRKLPRAADKVALSIAIGTLEIARQLAILNSQLESGNRKPEINGKKKRNK